MVGYKAMWNGRAWVGTGVARDNMGAMSLHVACVYLCTAFNCWLGSSGRRNNHQWLIIPPLRLYISYPFPASISNQKERKLYYFSSFLIFCFCRSYSDWQSSWKRIHSLRNLFVAGEALRPLVVEERMCILPATFTRCLKVLHHSNEMWISGRVSWWIAGLVSSLNHEAWQTSWAVHQATKHIQLKWISDWHHDRSNRFLLLCEDNLTQVLKKKSHSSMCFRWWYLFGTFAVKPW
jgi:hypothetical protein